MSVSLAALSASFLHDDALVFDLVGLRRLIRIELRQRVDYRDLLKLLSILVLSEWCASAERWSLRTLVGLSVIHAELVWFHLPAVAHLRQAILAWLIALRVIDVGGSTVGLLDLGQSL